MKITKGPCRSNREKYVDVVPSGPIHSSCVHTDQRCWRPLCNFIIQETSHKLLCTFGKPAIMNKNVREAVKACEEVVESA